MQSSKLSESEELQRRTIAAQIKLEEKKLQLEIQIRKKNEEEKQKELLKKQQKEALLNQRKEEKKVKPLKSEISRLSQDSEVKDSLSQEKADEIQNNLQSIIPSQPTDTLSADTESHISRKNIQKPEKQNSDRNDFEDAVQNKYSSKIDQDEEEDDDSTHKNVNIVAHKGRVTPERLPAHKIPEDLYVQKTELNVTSLGPQKYNAREEFIRGNEQKSNLKNIEVIKNNLPADQLKMEANPSAIKGDRDNLGGGVKMQLELANQMKKFKLDEEKKKKSKEEAGLQRKHEILRQIKGASIGQPNPVKPDKTDLNSFSIAEKDRNLRNSKNFSPKEEEVVSRQNKPMESRNEQNSPEASQEEIQYEESSHSEGPIEKEQEDFEQSHVAELQNNNEQYGGITQSFNSQRNDMNLKASQQRSSGNYKDVFKNDSALSYENKGTQDHQPQSYAQLHARKNQNPEMKTFKPGSDEGLSKLLESYEKGKPEEDQGHYQISHEDYKRNDDIELNYSQSEREFEDTNQNPLLTFGRKDFIKKDEGMNPLDMSNSLRENFHEVKPSKAQDKPNVDQGNWGYSKSIVEIQQPGDNSYEPLQEQEGDEEGYEYDNDAPQAEEDEEQNNNTGEFGNNVDGEQWQNPSDEDYPDQSRLTGEKFYYIGDQQHLGSFNGSGSKKKELRRYGDDQEDDFASENHDYKSQDKPARVRKGWGETKNDSNSAKDPTSMNSFTPIGSEGNEEEVATDRQETEEVKHEDDRKVENKLITFDDSEDEAARQRKMKKFENFMQRRQESQERIKEKKEKDKAKKAQNQRQKEEITFGNVSDDGTPRKPKSPINRDKYSKNIKQEQEKVPAPTSKGMRPPSANIRNQEKPPRRDPQEELKSVEASAKSNKSEMKSPSAPNNIFAPQRPSITGKKEFSKPSNKQNIKNAITNVCLAGEPNRKEREEVLAKLEEVKSEVNFILVFNAISARLAFKAVYAYDSLSGEVKKVYSNGTVPDTIDSKMVQNYYNYNNGPKEFKPIQGNKNFSLRVDAVSLQPQLFRKPTSQNIF